MFCIKCGTEMKEGQLFCPKCGYKIEVEEVVAPQVEYSAPTVPAAPKAAAINAQKVIAVPNPVEENGLLASSAQSATPESAQKTTYTIIPKGELHEIIAIPGQKTVGRAVAQRRANAIAAPQPIAAPMPEPAARPKAKKQNSKSTIIALIVLFILIVIAIASYFIIFKGKNSDKSDKSDKKKIEETKKDSVDEKEDKKDKDGAVEKEEKNDKEDIKEVKPSVDPQKIIEEYINGLKDKSIASSAITVYCGSADDGEKEYSTDETPTGVIDCMSVNLDKDEYEELVSVEIDDKNNLEIVVYKYSEKDEEVKVLDTERVEGYDIETGNDVQIDIFSMEYESQQVIGYYRWENVDEQDSIISFEVWSLIGNKLNTLFDEKNLASIDDLKAGLEKILGDDKAQDIDCDALFIGKESIVDILDVKKIARIYMDLSIVDNVTEEDVESGTIYLGGYSEQELEEFSENNCAENAVSVKESIDVDDPENDKAIVDTEGQETTEDEDDPENGEASQNGDGESNINGGEPKN